MELYSVISWNPEHNKYPQENLFDETLNKWVEKHVPHRLKHCILSFWAAFQRIAHGGTRPKTYRYDTLTVYNVDGCHL